MLLSDIDPIIPVWIDFFVPLFSGIAKAIVIITMLILIRIADIAFSRLITRMTGNCQHHLHPFPGS